MDEITLRLFFCKFLFYLRVLGNKSIELWDNSPGMETSFSKETLIGFVLFWSKATTSAELLFKLISS